jgi:hypothetical protein
MRELEDLGVALTSAACSSGNGENSIASASSNSNPAMAR